jgi:Na+-translocating ferredoxin:NAD+ oxidoreductase RnfG subunit
MKKILLIVLLGIALVPAMAQNQHHQHGQCGHSCGNCPHHQAQQQQQAKTINGMTPEIVNAFPTAKIIEKEAKWIVVYDANKKVLGYAVYSKPASIGIKGYNGETPLMIALSPKKKVMSVTLLDNQETPSFLTRVVNAGLLKSWDGMKAKKAAKKKVDTVSGATYSSRSIIQTLQAALSNL